MLIQSIIFDLNNVIEDYDDYESSIDDILKSVVARSPLSGRARLANAVGSFRRNMQRRVDNSYVQHYPFFWRFLLQNEMEQVPAQRDGALLYREYIKQYVRRIKVYPGVHAALRDLSRDFKLGVVANGNGDRIWAFLKRKGLAKYFTTIVPSGETPFVKPDKQLFDLALFGLGAAPVETVMVGDRLDTDILGANRRGLWSVRVAQGPNIVQRPKSALERPDFTIPRVRDIGGVRVLCEDSVLSQGVIMCGGRGKRLGAPSRDKQKCLIDFQGKPLLRYVLDGVELMGLKSVAFIANYRSGDVVRYCKSQSGRGWKSHLASTVGKSTGRALCYLKDELEEHFVYMHGDVILPSHIMATLIKRFYCSGKKICVCVTRRPVAPTHPVIDIREKKVRVCRMSKEEHLPDKCYYSMGLAVLKSSLFRDTSKQHVEFMVEEILEGIDRNSVEFVKFGGRWLHFATQGDFRQSALST